MPNPTMLTVLTALAFLSPGHGQKPAGDFAFRLEYGVCTTDVLDTFQGVFVRDLGRRVPPVSIPLMLPQESLDAVFRAVVAVDFFNYPSDFRSTPSFAPSQHFKLTVRNSGVTHTVSWQDNALLSTKEANRLRQMLNVIIELIRGLPQVQRLPLAQVGCG